LLGLAPLVLAATAAQAESVPVPNASFELPETQYVDTRIDAWQKANRPVEFHLYEHGGHGFGLGKQGTTSTGWFEAMMQWLDTNGLLARR
jgi:hypothetical protein